MSFKSRLSQLLERVPGALGAILADWEGEAVDQSTRMDDYELRVIGAHKGIILQNLRRSVDRLRHGDLREMVITTHAVRTVVLPITREYFLVLMLERRCPLGPALFEAHGCIDEFRREMG